MSGYKQKRAIERFLKGIGTKNIDVFSLYQWIDRCYYQGWWDLACALGANIPPNSLILDYHKRLEFLLRECRTKLNEQFVEVKNPGSKNSCLVPREFFDLCAALKISFGGKVEQRISLIYLGKKLGLMEEIDSGGCIFNFYNMDATELIEWLRKHGLQHLNHQNSKVKELPRKRNKRVLIKVSWTDMPDLIQRIAADVQERSVLSENARTREPLYAKGKVDIYGFRAGSKRSRALEILNGGTMNDVVNELGQTFYDALNQVRRSGDFAITTDAQGKFIIIKKDGLGEERPADEEIKKELSGKREAYRAYFQTLLDALRAMNFTNAQKGQPQSWYSFSTGLPGIYYSNCFAQGGRVRAELYIDRGDLAKNKALFDNLLKMRDDLERAFGESLEWERLDSKRASRIAIYRPGTIDMDEKTLEEIKNWSIERLLKFKDVFAEEVRKRL